MNPMMQELIWVAPFAILLASIAVFPLLAKHWWEKNYPFVSLALGLIIVIRYAVFSGGTEALIHTGIEYVSFICLIGALYAVSGGIHISVKGEATPLANCVFLFIGAVLANFLGTTGASMVLIRPWIRMNKYRITAHHIVFFIFIVSNIGGALTPIGDPPLFLGYLKGVPFFWVLEHMLDVWIPTISIVLGIFYIVDSANFKRAPKAVRDKETAHEDWCFEGAHNVFFLAMIIGSVFINQPLFLREAIMVLAVVLSLKTTPERVHKANDFGFEPIKEVAVLFAGIFATMIPAIAWLEHYAPELGIRSAGQFYWGTGILSSVLDNAPTYLNFLSTAVGLFGHGTAHVDKEAVRMLLESHPLYVKAISSAAVFFGAMTYIGNGPNFLVKSIAEQAQCKVPTFFGYILRFSLPVLLPVFTLIWLLFFR